MTVAPTSRWRRRPAAISVVAAGAAIGGQWLLHVADPRAPFAPFSFANWVVRRAPGWATTAIDQLGHDALRALAVVTIGASFGLAIVLRRVRGVILAGVAGVLTVAAAALDPVPRTVASTALAALVAAGTVRAVRVLAEPQVEGSSPAAAVVGRRRVLAAGGLLVTAGRLGLQAVRQASRGAAAVVRADRPAGIPRDAAFKNVAGLSPTTGGHEVGTATPSSVPSPGSTRPVTATVFRDGSPSRASPGPATGASSRSTCLPTMVAPGRPRSSSRKPTRCPGDAGRSTCGSTPVTIHSSYAPPTAAATNRTPTGRHPTPPGPPGSSASSSPSPTTHRTATSRRWLEWVPSVSGFRGRTGGRRAQGAEIVGRESERTAERDVVISELIGVYHADGSLRGELAYMLGKLAGRSHCALCEITHGTLRRRQSFDACVATLPVPFDLVHLDERSKDVAAASEGRTPCVLARTSRGIVLLLGADELASCAGEPARLRDAIDRAVDALALGWPARPAWA